MQLHHSAWRWGMALLLSGLSTNLMAQDCKASLCGTVTDGDTGQPFPYAEIFVVELNQLVLSDEQGQFHLHGLCEGAITVECSHLGCGHLAKEIIVQGDVTLDFELHHHEHHIEEITIVAKRRDNEKASQSLTDAALASAQGQTLGDALQTLPGVSALRTGAAIAKPVIRGLHSDRVLTVSNGVRMEGQQWGLDHGPEVDPYLAQRLGVVMGAYSLRYGADAIGGVVLVEPKPLEDIRGGWHGECNLAAFGNGRGGALSGLLERQWMVRPLETTPPPAHVGFLAARLQGTFRRSGNLRSPDYFLENTGLRESNGSAAIGWYRRANESHQVTRSVELFNSAFFTDIGIFRGAHIGNLTDLENAIERGRPSSEGRFSWKIARPAQRVAHHLFKAKAMTHTGEGGSKLSVQYARQYNHRQEFDAHKRFGSPPPGLEEPSIELEITTHSAEAIWEQAPKPNLTGGLGAQWTQQRNTTDRGALLPDYDNRNLGFFWMERWTQNHGYPLTLDAGLRYDRRRLYVERRENTLIDQTLRFDNLSGTFGLTKQVPVHFKLGLMFGSAWRSPNVNELYSDGVHHGTASYERGDVGLRPERSLNTNLRLDFFSDHIHHGDNVFTASVSAYINLVRDFIYLTPLPEPVLTIRGAFPAFEYAQADARLAGLDWSAEFRPQENWALLSSFSLLRARNRRRDEPLAFMPADRFRHSLTHYLRKPEYGEPREDLPFVRLSVENVLRQSRVPDGQDFAPAPKGYTLLNLEAGLTFSWHPPQTLRLLLAVENVANVRYRDYLNRLRYFGEEAGRDVSLRAKFVF